MRQEATLSARRKPSSNPRIPEGGARGVGGGFDGGATVGTRMQDDFESAGGVYHIKDIGPQPDLRTKKPAAGAQANPKFA
ncbi:hypothetical protein NBRC116589_17680 [Ruegeria sp. HU-ET01832]